MQVVGRHGGKGFLVTSSGLKVLQDVNEGGGGWRAVSGCSSSPGALTPDPLPSL